MKRILIGLGVALSLSITAGLVFAYFFPHVLWIHWARYSMPKEEYGLLYKKPIERAFLKSREQGSVAAHTFEFGSLVFQTPWPSSKRTETKDQRTIVFPGSRELALMEPGDLPLKSDLIAISGGEEAAKIVFGKAVLESDSALHEQIVEVSLNDELHRPTDLMKVTALTVLKTALYPDSDNASFYSFSTRYITGWQYGPSGSAGVISLDFYDQRDVHYQMVVTGMKQREIDALIQTIRDRQAK